MTFNEYIDMCVYMCENEIVCKRSKLIHDGLDFIQIYGGFRNTDYLCTGYHNLSYRGFNEGCYGYMFTIRKKEGSLVGTHMIYTVNINDYKSDEGRTAPDDEVLITMVVELKSETDDIILKACNYEFSTGTTLGQTD